MNGNFIDIEGVSGSGKTTLIEKLIAFLRDQDIAVVVNMEPTNYCPVGRLIREVIEGRKPDQDLLERAFEKIREFMKTMGKKIPEMSVVPEIKILLGFLELPVRAMKKLFKGQQLEPREFQSLYVVDRYFDLMEFIIPHTRKGFVVLNDRFLLSTCAYGGAYGVSITEIFEWHAVILGDIWHFPTATLYVKVSAETAIKRLFDSGKQVDVWERKEKIKDLVESYESAVYFLKEESRHEGIPDTFYVINGELTEDEVFEQVKPLLGIH